MDRKLESREPADWDERASVHLEHFLTLQTPYAGELAGDGEAEDEQVMRALTRRGKPTWSEEDFQRLLARLGHAGCGWLRESGVRERLAALAATWQAPPPVLAEAERPDAHRAAPSMIYHARDLLKRERFQEALDLSQQILDSATPAEQRETEDGLALYFTDEEEFQCFSNAYSSLCESPRSVVWVTNDLAEGWFLRGFALIELKDCREAARTLKEALKLVPRNPRYLNELGHCLQELEQHQKACAVFRRCIAACQSIPWEVFSDAIEKAKQKGQALIDRGQTESGRSLVSAAEKHESVLQHRHRKQESRAWRGVGYSLIELRRWDEAEAVFQESLKLEPNNRSALDELAYIRRHRDDASRPPVGSPGPAAVAPPPLPGLPERPLTKPADEAPAAAPQGSSPSEKVEKWKPSVHAPVRTALKEEVTEAARQLSAWVRQVAGERTREFAGHMKLQSAQVYSVLEIRGQVLSERRGLLEISRQFQAGDRDGDPAVRRDTVAGRLWELPWPLEEETADEPVNVRVPGAIRVNTCGECGGQKVATCPDCHGHGEGPCRRCGATGRHRCPMCDGTGVVASQRCGQRGGSGVIPCGLCRYVRTEDAETFERIGRGMPYIPSRAFFPDEISHPVRCPTCEAEGECVCHRCRGKGVMVTDLLVQITRKVDANEELLIPDCLPGFEGLDTQPETLLELSSPSLLSGGLPPMHRSVADPVRNTLQPEIDGQDRQTHQTRLLRQSLEVTGFAVLEMKVTFQDRPFTFWFLRDQPPIMDDSPLLSRDELKRYLKEVNNVFDLFYSITAGSGIAILLLVLIVAWVVSGFWSAILYVVGTALVGLIPFGLVFFVGDWLYTRKYKPLLEQQVALAGLSPSQLAEILKDHSFVEQVLKPSD